MTPVLPIKFTSILIDLDLDSNILLLGNLCWIDTCTPNFLSCCLRDPVVEDCGEHKLELISTLHLPFAKCFWVIMFSYRRPPNFLSWCCSTILCQVGQPIIPGALKKQDWKFGVQVSIENILQKIGTISFRYKSIFVQRAMRLEAQE